MHKARGSKPLNPAQPASGRARRLGVWSVTCLAVALVALLAGGSTAARAAAPVVHIPADEAPHSQPVEWWYFSGHLTGVDASGHVHEYGFSYTTFQFLDTATDDVYYGDFAISDLTANTFQYGGQEATYPVPQTVNSFALHTGNWTMAGGDGRDALSASLPGYSVDLALQTNEPAVLEGNGGLISNYGPFGSSYYYSWTSLLTSGVVIDHGVRVQVTGLSWMDHQWGPIDLASGAGWDWFSMQLSDGQQYMLYFIRNAAGQIVSTIGTRVSDGGEQVTSLAPGSFSDQATSQWTSPATGITYGSSWRVQVPGGSLTVTPYLADSEVDLLNTQNLVYWEGDVAIQGQVNGADVHGVGYTEIAPPTGG
jgi:predicted secreted hydrolase